MPAGAGQDTGRADADMRGQKRPALEARRFLGAVNLLLEQTG